MGQCSNTVVKGLMLDSVQLSHFSFYYSLVLAVMSLLEVKNPLALGRSTRLQLVHVHIS